MNINVSISAAIRQTMLITRQSIQSVEILQYGQEELEAFVKERTERNPLIGLSSATQSRAPCLGQALCDKRPLLT